MMVSAVIEPWITVNNSTYIPFLHIFNILPAYSDIFEFIRYDTGINAYIICIAMIFLTPIAPGLAGVIFFALGLFIMVGVPNYLNSLGFSGFAYVGPWGYVFLIACFLISLTELLLLINIKEIRRKMLEIKM
jgi:hypothetical protein